jgi:ectoine hydroxylase-related dioxygenase (phytanoyl-CoA dioxygenase family)
MSSWLFQRRDAAAAAAFYEQHGFVGFTDLLSPEDVAALDSAYWEAGEQGKLNIVADKMAPNPDAIERHPLFEKYCRDPRIVARVADLIGDGIELQHSKLNAKPGGGATGGAVAWHQDWPFFQHTNFDLLACTIHMDDEGEGSGALEIIPGSHRWGVKPHENDKGFAYEYTGPEKFDEQPSVLLTCPAGTVTMHHCLAMHRSAPRTTPTQRRHLIFEYRAEDAVQFSGVVTRCAGTVIQTGPRAGHVRFTDGQSFPLRGKLIDLHQKYAPDR